MLTQPQAQQSCNAAGGHLASWASLDEQADVEGYYISQVSRMASSACNAASCSQLPQGWHSFLPNTPHHPHSATAACLQGFLIPEFHKNYWAGMTTNKLAPDADFKMLDPYAKPGKVPYKHWGVMQPGNVPEPNNRLGGESCAVANMSQSYANAWGWADAKCGDRYASICIIRRKSLLSQALAS